ncbi:MAG TPA: NepR family anti-sigma factor [Beijerinckiaceae bacterium]|nr:NepR family anti-sigma factor [Beijerinckiaceae bacterium]
MLNTEKSNPFRHGETGSEAFFDNKVRLALSRGLAQAYGEVLKEPIPPRLRDLVERLERREREVR